MNKKTIIFITIIIILLIFTTVILLSKKNGNTKLDNKSKRETEVQEDFKEFTEMYMKSGMSKHELELKTNNSVLPEDIMIGKDSYLRLMPLKGNDNLNKYEKQQNFYAENVEKYIMDNFDFKIESTVTTVDNQILVKVLFKSYYYRWYLNELQRLQQKLITMAGYDSEEIYSGAGKEKTEIIYKSKIKAMEILNNYLNDYLNNYELISADVIYDFNDKTVEQSTLESYYLKLSGIDYPQIELGSDEFQKKMDKRIKQFIETAIQNGTLDKKDPLKLK